MDYNRDNQKNSLSPRARAVYDALIQLIDEIYNDAPGLTEIRCQIPEGYVKASETSKSGAMENQKNIASLIASGILPALLMAVGAAIGLPVTENIIIKHNNKLKILTDFFIEKFLSSVITKFYHIVLLKSRKVMFN